MKRALTFDARSTILGVGRSSVALGGLIFLAFTPDSDLFPAAQDGSPAPRCDGPAAVSLWCFASGSAWSTFSRLLAIGVLLLVAAGYRPRWTCVPHWYITLSLGLAAHIGSGGERVARLITLLLIPLCLSDRRVWQWAASGPAARVPPWWRGASYAGHLAIRAQVALIYGEATITKLVEPEWRNGTAMHYVLQNAYFGAQPRLAEFLATPLLRNWSVPTITWGTLAAEAFLAISAFGSVAVRRWALVVGIGLHGTIMVTLGLLSFGLVMIGLLCVAVGNGRRTRSASKPYAQHQPRLRLTWHAFRGPRQIRRRPC